MKWVVRGSRILFVALILASIAGRFEWKVVRATATGLMIGLLVLFLGLQLLKLVFPSGMECHRIKI